MHPLDLAAGTPGDLEQLATLATDIRPEAVSVNPDEPGISDRQPAGDP